MGDRFAVLPIERLWAAPRRARGAAVRARIVLLAADGERNVDIGRRVEVCLDVVFLAGDRPTI